MKVKYFAWVRERIGKDEETLDPPADVQTVGEFDREVGNHEFLVQRRQVFMLIHPALRDADSGTLPSSTGTLGGSGCRGGNRPGVSRRESLPCVYSAGFATSL
jgi:hypothetical protein